MYFFTFFLNDPVVKKVSLNMTDSMMYNMLQLIRLLVLANNGRKTVEWNYTTSNIGYTTYISREPELWLVL